MKISDLPLPERVAFARQDLPHMFAAAIPEILTASLERFYFLPPATARQLVDDFLDTLDTAEDEDTAQTARTPPSN